MGRSRTGGGGDYELKATFTATADTSGLEAMEKKIAKLESRMKRFSKMAATGNISQKGADQVAKKLMGLSDTMDKIDDKDVEAEIKAKGIEETENKVKKLDKYLKAFVEEDRKMTVYGNADHANRVAKQVQTKYEKLTKEAFELRMEAKMTGDKSTAEKARKLEKLAYEASQQKISILSELKNAQQSQAQIDELRQGVREFGMLSAEATVAVNNRDAIRGFSEAEAMGRKLASEAFSLSLTANSEPLRREAEDARNHLLTITSQIYEAKLKLQGVEKSNEQIDALQRELTALSQRSVDIPVDMDTDMALTEIKTIDSSLSALMRRAFNIMLTASNEDVKQKSTEVYGILSNLKQQSADIKMNLKGKQEVEQGITSLTRNLTELTSRPWEAEVAGDTSQAQAAFQALAAQARAQFARAYRLQIKAETLGFTEAASQANDLKRDLLNLAQQRTRVAVELQGVSPVIAGLLTVKKTADSAAGTYRIAIDYSKIAGAVASLGTLSGASRAVGGALAMVASAFRNSAGTTQLFTSFARAGQGAIMAFALALGVIAVAAAGPFVAGLTIAIGTLATFGAGLGLVAAVAAPVISGLTNFEETTKKVDTTQKAATSSANALAGAERQLAKANEGVAKAASSGEKAISQAIQAHEDAIRGVASARKSYDQAVQGVQEAERQGEESIASAIRAHEQSVEAVGDAYRNVDKAVQAAADAEIAAQESIRQAVKAHDNALRGLDDAYRAYDKAAQAVTDAEIDAQENVRQAINAHDDAIKGLAYAQQDYSLAQQDSTDAQEELTRATEEYNDALATEEQRLLGLRYDLEGLGINQRQLALDIADAAKDIRTAENSDERARAALRYEELLLRQKQGVLSIAEAQRRLQDSQVNGTDQLQSAYDNQQGAIEGVNDALRSEQRAADGVQDAYEQYGETAAGITRAQVEGARSVRDANESLADAVRGIGDAQDDVYETSLGIQKAQIDGARSIADANQGITDAQRDLNRAIVEEGLAQAEIGKARDESARNILKAQDAVLEAQLGIEDALRREGEAAAAVSEARIDAEQQMMDALQAVTDAQERVNEATEANRLAQNALNEAIGDLPIEGVAELREAYKALWEQFKAGTYDARVAIMQLGMDLAEVASGALPYLIDAANATTFALIEGFWNVYDLWNNTGVFGSFIDILNGIPSVTQGITEGLGGIFGGLINVLAQAMPWIDQFAWYIADVGARFATWTNSADGREQIKKFFEGAAIVLPAIWNWIYEIGAGLLNWSTQHPEEVLAIFNFISGILSGMVWAIGTVISLFTSIESVVPGFTAVAASVATLALLLGFIPKVLREGIFDLAKYALGFGEFGDKGAKGTGMIGTALSGLTGPLKNALGSLATVFTMAGGGMTGLRAILMSSVPIFGLVSAPIWLIVAAVAALALGAYLIYQNWDWIGPWFWSLWEGVKNVASAAWAYISGDIYAAGTAIWTFLTTQWGYISQWWSQIMASIGLDASISWGGIYGWVEWALYGISSLLTTIMPYVAGYFAAAWDGFVLIVSGVWTIISGLVSGGLQVIMGLLSIFVALFTLDWELAWSGLGWIVSGVFTGIGAVIEGAFYIIGGIFYSALAALESMTGISFTSIYYYIADALSDAWDIVVWVFQGIWNYLFGASIVPDIVNAFYYAFWSIYDYITTPLSDAWSYIVYVWDSVWDYLFGGSVIPDIENAFYDAFWQIYSYVADPLYAAWEYVEWVWDGVYDYLFGNSIMPDIESDMDSSWSNILSTISQYSYDAWSTVEENFDGIYDYLFGNSIMPDMEYDFDVSWNTIWAGAAEFGGWIYDTLNDAFGETVKTALDWLSELLYGAQQVLDAIGDPGGWSATIGTVAAAIDYYHDGGIKEMADGGVTSRDRGGIGTDHPNDQLVVWNEQVGNEAWIAERGPEAANLGYLSRAASWFDMAVVPQTHIAERSHEKEETGKQVLPPPFHSLAGGAGTGDKRKMMADGGIMYMAHGDTLPWGSGLTSQTAKTAEEIYNDNDHGNLYYNSYYGHPDGYPEREAYSVDWWDGYRGGWLTQSAGDSIVSDAESATDFSYWIYNGSDSYDGSIGAADPHLDHAHTTFMPGLDLGSGSGAGGVLRRLAKWAIEQFMPDVPDFGEGMVPDAVEGVGEHIREGAIEWIMSLLPKGSNGPATTAEVEEWVTAGLEYGNAFEANAQNIADMASRAMQESTGDPNAINDYDINAQNGDPSKGLMQVTGASWSDHRAMYGEDAGNFDSNWSDPVMNSAVASRHMKNRYGYVVGANGSGYANGGVATGPQLGLIGEAGNELMIPLDDPNAVNMLARAFAKTDPVRNRATEYASSRTEVRDNIIQSGVEEVMEVGITGGEALIAEKIDNMKDELKDEIIASFAETELGDSTLDRMVQTAVATALAVVSSRAAREIIDESVGGKLEFDTDMS